MTVGEAVKVWQRNLLDAHREIAKGIGSEDGEGDPDTLATALSTMDYLLNLDFGHGDREDDPELWDALEALRGPEAMVELPKGGALLVDALGAQAIETRPAREPAVLVELAGRLNKTTDRWSGMFLLHAKQAAELIANVIVAAQRFAPFAKLLDREIAREKVARRA